MVCAGDARRVYVLNGLVLEKRFLPNALGLEPVTMHAYRYDAQGGLTQPDDYLRIATQLAQADGWLAYRWSAQYAEAFMQQADAIIWLDDARTRRARAMDRGSQADQQEIDAFVRAVKRGVRWLGRRRSGDDGGEGHLLEIALESTPVDPFAVVASLAVSEFPEKTLRITHDEQRERLNAVRSAR